jgi:hypothetical protein
MVENTCYLRDGRKFKIGLQSRLAWAKTPYLQNNQGMTQAVENLASKREALSQIPVPQKKKKFHWSKKLT